jgi:putative Mg2+ transporter-C (MgtC) family protein
MGGFWQGAWTALREDFSDLPDAEGLTRLLLRLFVAALLGGILGYERERAGKEAGLRTHMLVCLGAALFVFIPEQAGISDEGLSRVIQGLVTGIGFLGGGTILKLSSERRIEGLTTAAGIWLTAAIGIAAGLGREASAVVGTVVALLVLAALAKFSHTVVGDAEPMSKDGRHPQQTKHEDQRPSQEHKE